MGSLSIWHWLIVLAVVLVLFGGGGKLSSLMGDLAKGIKSFRKNMEDDASMAEDAKPDARISSSTPDKSASFNSDTTGSQKSGSQH
ncbi:MAG: twin-arginine translocase TatA/TatE family subunit [Acetobacter sp.]|jgi:sec-independent protein translocase protein TatA|nr:twin-arginine translocase TatA/TatE family subunit [Acetobacter sp.]MCH4062541.1 twin-arginine translocase TatA/TatE family subunit [Acetobacter sp.]MCH4088613.1 twin-arginine translocase TatA/TatE family subunit [Acetobacter sp.]MCI1292519.1 twin-arginine translocase TatA/TatE family subunit [Acetobacter sp.]MCI1319383.1 twin-arginine translocase TatA/TatE family subunit [Acetobacter sp.]